MSVECKTIPFLDLVAQHEELKEELCEVFRKSLSTAAFIGGEAVRGFEQDFAAFCQTDHCVGVGSGTDALRFALIAAGIEPGDIVLTVPNTFIATTEAISQAGGYPVFLDIDQATYNLDPEKLREYLDVECAYDSKSHKLIDRKRGRQVSAIVPVHLYGQTADMDPILELAEQYDLTVVEDACQAHGAEYFSRKQNRWLKAGSMGKAAAFSFYPGKNLGACGEAGAVTTNDAHIAQQIGMLRDHGQTHKYFHQVEGYNGRLDAIQAGILRIKLPRLSQWNDQRRERAATYDSLFADTDRVLIRPFVPTWSRPSYHLYVVRVAQRDLLLQQLGEAGIGTGIHYPVPLHLSAAYEVRHFRLGDFPVAERVAAEILSLPMFPSLTSENQSRVVSEALHFLSAKPVGTPV